MVLKNDQQLAGAQNKLSALEAARAEEADADGRASYDYLISEVRRGISEYVTAKSGSARVFNICSVDDLGAAAIKARLAAGLTQRQLADELGVREQQVSKDETREYESARISKLADVLDALGYELVGAIRPKVPTVLRQISEPDVPTFATTASLMARFEPTASGTVVLHSTPRNMISSRLEEGSWVFSVAGEAVHAH